MRAGAFSKLCYQKDWHGKAKKLHFLSVQMEQKLTEKRKKKAGKPIMIWRHKKPRCFKSTSPPDTLAEVSYFDGLKSWMQVHIMENFLDTLNCQLVREERKVMLLLDNATVHLPSLIDMYSNIKIVFLPKNTTSRLQPLDAGITQSFKSKYRKK